MKVYDSKSSLNTYLSIMERSTTGRDLHEVSILVNSYFTALPSKALPSPSNHSSNHGSWLTLSSIMHTSREVTRIYAPPEWFLYQEYKGQTLRIWTLGILCRLPLPNTSETIQVATSGPMGTDHSCLLKECPCKITWSQRTLPNLEDHNLDPSLFQVSTPPLTLYNALRFKILN